ncbi:MAG: tRNA dihydrouridine synthase DusB [Candidatus Methylacidiphilales bacterium]
MKPGERLHPLLPSQREILVLAPMQDVTDLAFWRIMARYGGADLYVTEYFRVYSGSVPERHILDSLEQNPTGRPAVAQMIGQDIPSLCRTAEQLQRYPIVGIDLNLGCPAPIVCRKQAGGGLLPFPEKIDAILRELRASVSCALTVKTRIGFHEPSEFSRLLEVFARHDLDGLTVHGRTVHQMYRPPVHLEPIAQAVRSLPFPVIANGNILSAAGAEATRQATGARGLMLGRGAIRNPWLFEQIRQWQTAGQVQTRPTLRQLRAYIDELYRETSPPGLSELKRVAKIKKYLNFIAQNIPGAETFPEAMRRAVTERELFEACDAALDRDGVLTDPAPGESLRPTGTRDGCHAPLAGAVGS